jgi:DtxR family transcriptional regulator, Mn-dependent transcriptional regulator
MEITLTEREYDCLNAIKSLTADGWLARVKDVAAKIRVKPPTALGFISRLVEASLLEKGTNGYRLTKKGVQRVDELTRAHRLFETLLFRTGMPLSEAHRISSSIDKHIDERATSSLCSRLNHPKKCPHDMPIPPGDKYD